MGDFSTDKARRFHWFNFLADNSKFQMKYKINYLKALKTEQKWSEQMKSDSVRVDS